MVSYYFFKRRLSLSLFGGGGSLAHITRLSDWLATDKDDYVGKAVRFSSKLIALDAFRQVLSKGLLGAPLNTLPRYAVKFKKALWKIKNP